MKNAIISFIFFTVIQAIAFSQQGEPDSVSVFYLGGQTSMDDLCIV